MTVVLKRRAQNRAVVAGTALIGGLIVGGGVAVAPTALLESLVLALGLPAILPAATPPLGSTARLFLAGGFFVAGAIAVGALMLLLIRVTRKRPRQTVRTLQGDSHLDAEAPTLRKVDTHPDAPARRPIFAGSDLGTPFDEVRAPVPADPIGAEPVLTDTPDDRPHAEAEPDEALLLDRVADHASMVLDQAETAQAIESIDAPDAAAIEASVVEDQAEPLDLVAPEILSSDEAPLSEEREERTALFLRPDPVPEPVIVLDPPEPVVTEQPAEENPEAPTRLPISGRESVSELLSRLEDGLQRRAAAHGLVGGIAPVAASGQPLTPAEERVAPAPVAADTEAALREALGSLRQLALRGR